MSSLFQFNLLKNTLISIDSFCVLLTMKILNCVLLTNDKKQNSGLRFINLQRKLKFDIASVSARY